MMTTWTNTTSSSSSSTTFYIPVTTAGSATMWTPAAPRPQTPLEWLDAEIERTCAIARSAA